MQANLHRIAKGLREIFENAPKWRQHTRFNSESVERALTDPDLDQLDETEAKRITAQLRRTDDWLRGLDISSLAGTGVATELRITLLNLTETLSASIRQLR